MEHVRSNLAPGMKESEAGAIWNGFVHGHGTGWEGEVELALGFSLVWSGSGHPHLHGDRRPAGAGARADAVRNLGLRRRLLVRPHEEPLPGRAHAGVRAPSRQPHRRLRPGRRPLVVPVRAAELDRLILQIAEAGYPGQPTTRSRTAWARAHEPPYAHQAGPARSRMDGARGEPGSTGPRRRPQARGQFLDHRLSREAVALPGRSRAVIWAGSLNRPHEIDAQVGFYDTTLRDGEQTVGVVPTPDDKLEIARASRTPASSGSRRGSCGSPRTTTAPSS